MEQMVHKAIKRYLKKHYPKHMKKIIRRAMRILPKLKAKAPELGGKDNSLASNMDMFLLFIAYYEATNHRMGGEAIDEIIEDIYNRLKWLGKVVNINNKLTLRILRKYLSWSYQKYADKVVEKRTHGEWLETWGMKVNPNNRKVGYAFDLVGCPIAEYAKKYGYMELMPHVCALDHAYAKILHAKLIRTHTVATGSDSCDYWYVPDQSKIAKNYKGIIV